MIPLLVVITLCTLFGALIFMAGMLSAIRENGIFRAVRELKKKFSSPSADTFPYQLNDMRQLISYSGREERVPPPVTSRSMVVFAFGQSNAANSGGERYFAESARISNYWNGKFYSAADPLLGATGTGGTPWVRAANILIDQGMTDQVVLHAAGVGGSSIVQWRKGGTLHGMLESRLQAVPAGMPITHFFWHQGETDNPLLNRRGFDQYETGMREIIQLTKIYFPTSRFYIAIATQRADVAVSPQLQEVQRRLSLLSGVYLGPDTDLIGPDDRFDGTHLSGRGLERHANAWVEVLRNQAL